MPLNRFSLVCILFVFVFCSSYAQLHGGGCGKNERKVKCVDICNNCGQKEPCPLSECYEGCECIPGYLRNSSGVCVPKSQCNAVYTSPHDGEVALSGGCPNPDFCVVSCQLRNFKDGICLGPQKSLCNCFSQVPPEPIPPPSPGALVDTPPLITDSRTACPNRAKCNALCKKKGSRFTGGTCVGKDRRTCRCIACRPGTKGCPLTNPRPPLVVLPPPQRPPSKKRNPADLLSGGCPIGQACLQSCRLHGYRSGKCQGREKDLCRCLNCEPGVRGCPGLPEEVYPDFLEYYY